jgi:DNA mismatch repair ATPase MutS
MTVDNITILDLGILAPVGNACIFEKLCFATTNAGKEYLQQLIANPLNDVAKIYDRQKAIKHMLHNNYQLPSVITNGTLMVLQRFYDTHITNMSRKNDVVTAFMYKLSNSTDFSLTKYSVQHFVPFVQAMQQILLFLQNSNCQTLDILKQKSELHLAHDEIKNILSIKDAKQLSDKEVLNLAWFFKNKFKYNCLELIEVFCTLDAYCSIAKAHQMYKLCFPTFTNQQTPIIKACGVFHLLLQQPISQAFNFTKESNFLFLTGANMSGKSTFIKSLGVAVYLAHLGFGVPATNLELSLFDGIVSNINITDNINAGESYFFNEVKRIKTTLQKIKEKGNWLILIDELFKGTNVQDAMKCSTAVINGLAKLDNSVFILSTHLYEIAEDLQQHKNLQFHYFETKLINDELVFNYNLKTGISNDRFGYLILQKEGVLKLLQ